MAPEYISTRKASRETSVYNFGVVFLEIATRKRPSDVWSLESPKGLVEWAWDHYGNGELLSIVDERLQMAYDAKQVLKIEAMMPSLPKKMPIAGKVHDVCCTYSFG
ncbi:hypothetical protein Ancab_026208 [Ancistrocladus abbreviatus]